MVTMAGAMLLALAAALLTGQALGRLGFPVPDARRRIGCLDGLRGYLALFVMLHHFDIWMNRAHAGTAWGGSSSRALANFGPGGVALFFMTTGIVFYPRIRAGLARVDWRKLYISRLFRILPLQFVVIAVVAAISWRMAPDGHGTIAGNAGALLRWMTSYGQPTLFGYADAHYVNAAVLWSLWYEWVFYFVVLPLMALARDLTASRLPSWVLPAGLLVIGLVAGPFAVGPLAADAPVRIPPVFFFLPLFASGMIALDLGETRLKPVLASPAMAVVAAVALAAAVMFAPGPYGLPQLAAYALFFACVANGNSFGGIFAWRGSVVLGEISFGIYLIHGVVLYGLFTFLLPQGAPGIAPYVGLIGTAITVVLLSAAAHLVIERPTITLGRVLGGGRRPPQGDGIGLSTADVAP